MKHYCRLLLILLSTLTTSASVTTPLSIRRGAGGEAYEPFFPPSQAAHFCQLFIDDGGGHLYTLSTYAQHLVTILCGQPAYGDLTAEQVFTGLVFFFDDWAQQPLLHQADPAVLTVLQELHSGATLRIFPHQSVEGVVWYAPTDQLPVNVGAEHRRYMQEVFCRLNGEVQAANWAAVDAYVDRMLQYQCRFGAVSAAPSAPASPYFVPAIVALIAALLLAVYGVTSSRFNRPSGVTSPSRARAQ